MRWESPSWSTGLQHGVKQVQMPVMLLHSLSDKQPWERYDPTNFILPPSSELNSSDTVLLQGWLWH